MNEKQQRDRTVLNALAPGTVGPRDDQIVWTDRPDFDAGARGELPPGRREPTWTPSEDLGSGWREYEVEDGADLIFPWLRR